MNCTRPMYMDMLGMTSILIYEENLLSEPFNIHTHKHVKADFFSILCISYREIRFTITLAEKLHFIPVIKKL